MEIKEKLIEYMTKKDLSQVNLARKSGLSQVVISKLLSGHNKNPTLETLKKLAMAFNISPQELITNHENKKAPRYPPIYVISYADAGCEAHDYDDMGYPVWDGFDTVPRPADLKDTTTYALKVNGDSMRPMLKEGCIIVISPKSETRNGDVAVIRDIHDNVKVKVVTYRGDQIILGSFNPTYPPEVYKKEEIKFIHKVVRIRF